MTTNSNYKKRALAVRLWKIDDAGNVREDTRLNLAGHRAHALIESFGAGFFATEAQIQIWGLRKEIMAQYQRTAFDIYLSDLHIDGYVSICAGTEGEQLQLLFEGGISSATADFNAAPEVPFSIRAYSAIAYATQPVASNSAPGETDVAAMIEAIAKGAGLAFKNYGVSGIKLRNIHLSGTTTAQIQQLADAARVTCYLDNGTLSIWPDNIGTAEDGLAAFPVVDINAENGMIGSPTFHQTGIEVRCVCNPQIRFGQRVRVKSIVPAATGEWFISRVSHDLETMNPGGPWQTTVRAEVSSQYYESKRNQQ